MHPMTKKLPDPPNPEERLHAHHAELHAAHRAARDESVERLRANAEKETQQAIGSALARLKSLTDEHERVWKDYLAGGAHKQRMRALERATGARRGQVLAFGQLLAMPREALLAHEGFLAFSKALKSAKSGRKRSPKPKGKWPAIAADHRVTHARAQTTLWSFVGVKYRPPQTVPVATVGRRMHLPSRRPRRRRRTHRS
jgi:hypothetical protein